MSGLTLRKANIGFTLVEMVVVIIILGVLVVGVSSFLIIGTRIFIDSTSVEQALGESRFAIERMTRELRSAVPNSVRVATIGNQSQCIEFTPILASSSYLELPIAPESKTDSAEVMLPTQGINSDELLLVYPLIPEHIYGEDAHSNSHDEGHLFPVASVAGNTVTFQREVVYVESSPQRRFFMVNTPVSYCFLANGELHRYADYPLFNVDQPSPAQMLANGNRALMAKNIINNIALQPPINFTPASLINSAVVQLSPLFSVNGQEFQYQHQVQVINVP